MMDKEAYVRGIQRKVLLHDVLKRAWTALTQAGIETVLLKGEGLAACYPDPEERVWGDIDLFVGKKQYHDACRVMRETFPDAMHFDEEKEYYKHYNLIAEGVSIEIHRITICFKHPIDAWRYEKMERYGMTHAEPLQLRDIEVRVPEPTFNMLYVFLHRWDHWLAGTATEQQARDLQMLRKYYGARVDEKRLRRWIKELRMEEVYRGEVIGNREKVKGNREKVKGNENRWVRKWRTMKERWAQAEAVGKFYPRYARHMKVGIWLHGAMRLLAKDRKWE